MKFWQILLVTALGLACFTGTSWAQLNGLSVSGTESIKRPAELVRMQIELSAQGKTLPEALKKLAARREAASAQLAKLSADKATIKFGEPKLNATQSDRQRQMEMMVRQRMRQGGKKKKTPTEKPAIVSCSLSAEWKLTGKTAEELLLEAHGIEDKVRATDLAGGKSEEKTAEEEELAEEMGDQFGGMGMMDENEPKPGEAAFVYVAKIPAEEREKALAAAFAKARAQAGELAKAAGAELGELTSLAESTSTGNGPYSAVGMGNMGRVYYSGRFSQGAAYAEAQSAADSGEALGPQPGEVSMVVVVTAAFGLKTK